MLSKSHLWTLEILVGNWAHWPLSLGTDDVMCLLLMTLQNTEKKNRVKSWDTSGLWKTSRRVGQELPASFPTPSLHSPLQLLLGKSRKKRLGCLLPTRFKSHDNRELLGKRR